MNDVMSDTYVDELIDSGAVPPISGIEDKIAASPAPEWNQFVYETAERAKNFQLSWDQALDAAQGDALLNNLEKVFLKTTTPEEFAAAMEKAAQEG